MQRLENAGLIPEDRLPTYLTGFGAGLALVLLAEVAFGVAVGSPLVTDGTFLVGVITTIPFLVGISYAGYWLRSSALSPARYPRIGWWCLSGLGAFLFVNAALIAVDPIESWVAILSWLRWAVAFGAGTGLLIGCIEARAIERALTAERAVLRTEHVEQQRDYLDYLNGILRHEVLNAATIINGYASTVLETESGLCDRNRHRLEIVIDESEEMSTVIDDVRVLLRTTEGSYQPEAVNASRVLSDELDKLSNRRPSLEVAASIPDDVFVRADDLLARVFGNLLSNAVEHNDAATPRIEVTLDPGPETVRIEIADNGPGIPNSKLDVLFDRVESRGQTHGLGLYLVSQLVARYGGTVDLVETGPDGSRFAVELPTASSGRTADPIEESSTTALVVT
ncbi:sensor histidine kinase [Natrinema marinum]|uniref:sensor histidine kinase n=1 Tax=Natrinema marinum TaxID=2961598 RepID=UPI0020C8988B|nr:HAMP domain-containing sensor histidine kinase [Natrinema marinum]